MAKVNRDHTTLPPAGPKRRCYQQEPVLLHLSNLYPPDGRVPDRTGLPRGMAFPRATAPSKREDGAGRAVDTTKHSPSLNQMNRHGNGRSQRSICRKGPPSFARWNKPQRGLFLLLLLAGNVLVATLAWIIVRLVTG
jgi:hypothetical protein